MTEPYEVVAVVTRSGLDESWHHGAVVGLGADGSVAFTVGDPDVVVYPRSALKPFQAAAMLRAGLELPPRLLALVCASHAGTPAHVAGVREILAGAGLSEADLGNTTDLPSHVPSAENVLRAGGHRSPIYMNCSGKHAGMLATCRQAGWPADASYLDPTHPLQVLVADTIAACCGRPVAHVGVDGCGAPAFAVTLHELARGFVEVLRRWPAVREAMTSHPEMVGGPGTLTTSLMLAVPGLCGKGGAEGVFVAALDDGRAAAVKIADGTARARPAVTVASLALLGVDVAAAAPALRVPVLGHGHPVGEVRVAGSLAAAIAEFGAEVP